MLSSALHRPLPTLACVADPCILVCNGDPDVYCRTANAGKSRAATARRTPSRQTRPQPRTALPPTAVMTATAAGAAVGRRSGGPGPRHQATAGGTGETAETAGTTGPSAMSVHPVSGTMRGTTTVVMSAGEETSARTAGVVIGGTSGGMTGGTTGGPTGATIAAAAAAAGAGKTASAATGKSGGPTGTPAQRESLPMARRCAQPLLLIAP